MFELTTIDSAGAFPVGSKNENVPPEATSITPMSIESAASPNSTTDYEGDDNTGSSFHYNNATNDDTSIGDDNGSYSGHSWCAAGATATMMDDHSDSASDASSVRSINSWRSFKSGRSQNSTRSPSDKSSKSSLSRRHRSASPSNRKRSFLKKKNRTATSSTSSICSREDGDEHNKENDQVAAAAAASQKHPLYDKVKSLIERVMPNETSNVDEMMLQFEGREDELIMTLEAMVVDDTPPKKSMTKGKRPLKGWVSKKKQNSQNNKQQQPKRGGPGGTPPKPPPKKPPLPPSAKKSKRPGFPPRGKASPRKPPLNHARQPKSPNSARPTGTAVAALSSSSHTNSSRLTFSDDKSFFSAAESLTEIHPPTATAKETTSPRTQEEHARQEIVTDLEHFIERGNWDAVRNRAAHVEIKADLEEEIEDALSNATTLTSNSSMSQNMRLEFISPARGSDQEFTAEMERFVENNDWAGVVDAVKRLENRLSQVQQENDALKRGESSVVSENAISAICDAVTPPPLLNDSSNVSVASILSAASSRNSSVGGDTLYRLFSTGSVSSAKEEEGVRNRSTTDKTVVESDGSLSRQKHSSSSLSTTPKTKDKSLLSGAYGGSDGSSSGSGVLDMFFAQQEVEPLSPDNGLDLVFHHKQGHSPVSLLTTDEDRTSSMKELGNKKEKTNPVVPEPIKEVEKDKTTTVLPVAGPSKNAGNAPPQDESIRDLDSKLALAESKLSSALPSGLLSGDDDNSESSKENDDDMSIEIAKLDSVTDVLRSELELFEASETNMLEELEQESSPTTDETESEVSGTTTALKSSEAPSSTTVLRDESSSREKKVEVPLEDALEMIFQERLPGAGDESTIASSSTKSAIVIQNQGITKEFHIIEDTQEEEDEVYESFNNNRNDESEDDDTLQQQESYILTKEERVLLGLAPNNAQSNDTTNGIDKEETKDIGTMHEEAHPSEPGKVRNTLLQIAETQLHGSVEKTVTEEDTKSTDTKQEDKIDVANETIEVKQVVHSPPPPSQVKSKPPPQQPKADTGCACIIL